MAPRLSERSPSRANVFDVLRLAGALAVLVSHCYPLTGRGEPVADLTGQTLGDIGVSVFFAISGFLVTRSWSMQPSLWPFAAKRALRLLPALFVASWLTALVLGPIVTSLPLSTYFTTPQTWIYPARASLLITFNGRLPGVFESNPFPDAVNGSLWTLPVEATAYALVAVLGIVVVLQRREVMAAFLALLLIASAPGIDLASHLSHGADDTIAAGNLSAVLHLMTTFVAGATLYAWRDRITLSWLWFAVLAALWVVAWNSSWTLVTSNIVIAYGVLVLAYRGPLALEAVARPGDVSYGVYIYAFPVQQTIVHAWAGITPLALLLIAAPVSYLLGLASWRLIEARALSLKGRLVRRASARGALVG
jgi:peptidoglycan/LPS O-acetylase OafA/YrhL